MFNNLILAVALECMYQCTCSNKNEYSRMTWVDDLGYDINGHHIPYMYD